MLSKSTRQKLKILKNERGKQNMFTGKFTTNGNPIFSAKVTDKGYIGDAFEMASKYAIGIKNWNEVSPAGKPDCRYNGKCYDFKQNGTIIDYTGNGKYVFGSSRVVYATHIDYTVIASDNGFIEFVINLEETNFFVVDKKAFVKFLLSTKGMTKTNKARDNEVNIQTVWNYSKNAYHGRKGRLIEAWGFENDLADIITDAMLGF
jgi:hypothetical protein